MWFPVYISGGMATPPQSEDWGFWGVQKELGFWLHQHLIALMWFPVRISGGMASPPQSKE
jgi:hypothetical protein